MEEIDSSDSDATVNYGAEPPEAVQGMEIVSEAGSQGSTVEAEVAQPAAEPQEANIVEVAVEQMDVQIISSADTQGESIKPPSAKKRKRYVICVLTSLRKVTLSEYSSGKCESAASPKLTKTEWPVRFVLTTGRATETIGPFP